MRRIDWDSRLWGSAVLQDLTEIHLLSMAPRLLIVFTRSLQKRAVIRLTLSEQWWWTSTELRICFSQTVEMGKKLSRVKLACSQAWNHSSAQRIFSSWKYFSPGLLGNIHFSMQQGFLRMWLYTTQYKHKLYNFQSNIMLVKWLSKVTKWHAINQTVLCIKYK